MDSVNKAIAKAISDIKESGIYGCITGSTLTDSDFDTWTQVPDVDVFVYTEMAQVNAIDIMIHKYNCKPATKGEQWKIDRMIKHGNRKDCALSTVKLVNKDGIIINISWKRNQTTVLDVISNFDMTIVMKGYDINTGTELDLTEQFSEKNVAKPNPLRNQDTELYNVDAWLRQFDRVIKYWDRGFDTRPMARFYIEMIDDVLDKGSLFTTSKAEAYFDEFARDKREVRQRIETWLIDKEDI
jgi:hypothetical protein